MYDFGLFFGSLLAKSRVYHLKFYSLVTVETEGTFSVSCVHGGIPVGTVDAFAALEFPSEKYIHIYENRVFQRMKLNNQTLDFSMLSFDKFSSIFGHFLF